MIFVILASLTILTLGILLAPLFRVPKPVPSREALEIEFYRRQLRDLDRDEQSGQISREEAPAARRDIERRLLAVRKSDEEPPENTKSSIKLAVVLAILVPLAASLLEAGLAEPLTPDRAYADRSEDPDIRLNAAADKLAARLEKKPDAEGYRRLAGIDYALHRFGSSLAASQRAHDLGLDDAPLWSQWGESLVMANDGIVVMDAMACFKAALTRDPSDPRARFYLGLAESQIGNDKKAVAIWRDLEAASTADAYWRPMVDDAIARTAKDGGFDPKDIAPAPPDLTRLPVK